MADTSRDVAENLVAASRATQTSPGWVRFGCALASALTSVSIVAALLLLLLRPICTDTDPTNELQWLMLDAAARNLTLVPGNVLADIAWVHGTCPENTYVWAIAMDTGAVACRTLRYPDVVCNNETESIVAFTANPTTGDVTPTCKSADPCQPLKFTRGAGTTPLSLRVRRNDTNALLQTTQIRVGWRWVRIRLTATCMGRVIVGRNCLHTNGLLTGPYVNAPQIVLSTNDARPLDAAIYYEIVQGNPLPANTDARYQFQCGPTSNILLLMGASADTDVYIEASGAFVSLGEARAASRVVNVYWPINFIAETADIWAACAQL